MSTEDLVLTDWFRAAYFDLWPDNVTTQQVSVKLFSRGPQFSGNLASSFAVVKGLSSFLNNNPEWVEVDAVITSKTDDVTEEDLYFKRLTDSSYNYLQLGSVSPWSVTNVETSGGFYLDPVELSGSVQDLVYAAVFYLPGTFNDLDGTSITDPVMFATTKGIGKYVVAHSGAVYGQTSYFFSNPDNSYSLRLNVAGYGGTTNITNRARTSNVATLTVPGHTFAVGDVITVAGTGAPTFNVTSVITSKTSTTISFPCSGGTVSSTVSTGTVELRSSKFSTGYTILDLSAPKWEPPHAQHIWLEPQRVNFIANPSFESYGGEDDIAYFWRAAIPDTEAPECQVVSVINLLNDARPTAGWVRSTDTYDVEDPAPLVLESNLFPKVSQWASISFKISGSGTFNFGLIVYPADYQNPAYIRSDNLTISGGTSSSGFNRYTALVQVPDDVVEAQFRIEFQADGDNEFWVDDVLVDPHESQYTYFDGNSTDSLTDDYRWMGGDDYANMHFSMWYNNYKNTSSRITGSISESGEFIPGLTNDWVPNGTSIKAHWDSVTSVTPYNWEGNAFYPISDVSLGTQTVAEPTSTLSFLLLPID